MDGMADRAGRVIQRWIVRVCERYRVSGTLCRFFNVQSQKVEIGPACSCPIPVGFGRWIAIEKSMRIQNPRVRLVDIAAVGCDIGPEFKIEGRY